MVMKLVVLPVQLCQCNLILVSVVPPIVAHQEKREILSQLEFILIGHELLIYLNSQTKINMGRWKISQSILSNSHDQFNLLASRVIPPPGYHLNFDKCM